jgi:hypothetical protein
MQKYRLQWFSFTRHNDEKSEKISQRPMVPQLHYIMLLNICRMDRLRFWHERPTDSDCCLILVCTCLSVRNFENAINKSYTHVQSHCIFFFQCRTGVVADCFKFCGTRHARYTQMMSPKLCITKHFTMTQLKLFTLVGVANLLLEVSPELLYGAGPNCGVW